MKKIAYRNRARDHLEKAKILALGNDEPSLRYACLELRMTVESLVYDTLQTYIGETSNTVMEKWQPKQVLDELLYVDPLADKSGTISFGVEEQVGVPAKEMQVIGTDKRLSIQRANKIHNALGSFLHEPTLAQQKDVKLDQKAGMQKKVSEIIVELHEILSSPVWGFNIGSYINIDCKCGFKIRRKEEFLKEKKDFLCSSCGVQYDYYYDEKIDKWRIYPSTVKFLCDECSKPHVWPKHKMRHGAEFKCDCGYEDRIVTSFSMSRNLVQNEPEK